MIPATMRDFNDMFSRSQGNPASCVLRPIDVQRHAESCSAPDLDDQVADRPLLCTSSPG
jgi:hypothetical protein